MLLLVSADAEMQTPIIYIADVIGMMAHVEPRYSQIAARMLEIRPKESKKNTVDAAVAMFAEYGLAENVKNLLYQIHGVEDE